MKNNKKRPGEIKEWDHFVTVGGSNVIRQLKAERVIICRRQGHGFVSDATCFPPDPPIAPVSHTSQQECRENPSFPETTVCFYFRELSSSGALSPFKWRWDICRDEVQLVLWQNECCSSHLGVSSFKLRSRQRGKNERKQGGKQNESKIPEMKDQLKLHSVGRLYPADCSGGETHRLETDGLNPRHRQENQCRLPKTSVNASWSLHLSNSYRSKDWLLWWKLESHITTHTMCFLLWVHKVTPQRREKGVFESVFNQGNIEIRAKWNGQITDENFNWSGTNIKTSFLVKSTPGTGPRPGGQWWTGPASLWQPLPSVCFTWCIQVHTTSHLNKNTVFYGITFGEEHVTTSSWRETQSLGHENENESLSKLQLNGSVPSVTCTQSLSPLSYHLKQK